jgi:hypothetical protein
MEVPYFSVRSTPLFRSVPLRKMGQIYDLNNADSIKFVLRSPAWKVDTDDIVKNAVKFDSPAGIAIYQVVPGDFSPGGAAAPGTWQYYWRSIESGGAIVLETRPVSFKVAA